MADQLAQLQKKIEEIQSEKLSKFRALSGATHDTRELFRTIEAAIAAAKTAANGARSRVEALRADDTMYPEGRKRLIREAIDKAKAEVKKQQDRMEGALTILDAHLKVAALPRLDKSREMAARDELRLLLDSVPNPVGLMAELAQRDDELAAVAVSSYGESYLRARGVPEAKKAAEDIRNIAASRASQSGDPERQAVGKALAEVGTLRQAIDCSNQTTRKAMQGAEAAGAGL